MEKIQRRSAILERRRDRPSKMHGWIHLRRGFRQRTPDRCIAAFHGDLRLIGHRLLATAARFRSSRSKRSLFHRLLLLLATRLHLRRSRKHAPPATSARWRRRENGRCEEDRFGEGGEHTRIIRMGWGVGSRDFRRYKLPACVLSFAPGQITGPKASQMPAEGAAKHERNPGWGAELTRMPRTDDIIGRFVSHL